MDTQAPANKRPVNFEGHIGERNLSYETAVKSTIHFYETFCVCLDPHPMGLSPLLTSKPSSLLSRYSLTFSQSGGPELTLCN